jgi:transitional endoplasmic reticulum ATPase
MEKLASLTDGRSGADIEAICRRAALLALREWIAPKLTSGHVQVTEVGEQLNAPGAETSNGAFHADDADTPVVTSIDDTTTQEQNTTNQTSTSPFEIRLDHFEHAIDEQRERYAVQEAADATRARKEAGRQRLIDMAADYSADKKPALRGFRLWLARLFRLVP